MGSSYPTKLDIFPHLVDEFDVPDAGFWNRLLDAPFRIQTELGIDPSNPGAAWASMTDVADLLGRLCAFEAGKFTVKYPADAPVQVDFMNPTRFADSTKLIVVLNALGGQKGRKTGQDDIWNIVIRSDAGSPVGFDFHRFNMDSLSEHDIEYSYFAWEDRF